MAYAGYCSIQGFKYLKAQYSYKEKWKNEKVWAKKNLIGNVIIAWPQNRLLSRVILWLILISQLTFKTSVFPEDNYYNLKNSNLILCMESMNNIVNMTFKIFTDAFNYGI